MFLLLSLKKIKKLDVYFLKLSNATMTDSAPTMICIQGVPPVRFASHV